jgi:Peptidase family M28
MIDLRLWRAALLPIPVVVLVGMFSLQEVPGPLAQGLPPDAFDGEAASAQADDLALSAADPRPGSEADEQLGELVRARFSAIAGMTVSEQRFEGSFEEDEVELRNLIGVLPGESDRQIALIACRDTADGSGATTSIASTATLLEIANALSGSTHSKTLVFVSTDGCGAGALGARRFVRDYTGADLIDAAIVLSQPASQDPRPPLLIPWSTGPESTASQLAETAKRTVSEETGAPPGDEGPLDDLFRLAIPAAIGEQGPLIEGGLDAVRVSSSGELPPPAADDVPDDLSPDTLDRFGRASLSLLLTLDAASGGIEQGPSAYIGLAGNLLPGWTLSLLALALLLPVTAVAALGLSGSARSPAEAVRGLVWATVRVLPFLAALLLFELLIVIGLVPSPGFPFDPATESLGVVGSLCLLLTVAALGAAIFFLRPLRPPGRRAAATARPAALLIAALAGLGIWAQNPYLGLLVGIGLQAWVPAAGRAEPGRIAPALWILLGLLPALVAVIDLAGRLGEGLGVFEDLLLMFSGDQLGDSLALLVCLMAGAALAIIAAAGRGPAPASPEMTIEAGPGEKEPIVYRPPKPAVPERAEPEREGAQGAPAEEEPDQPEAEPEPERDPRLWSKPLGSSSPPPGRRRVVPRPSVA